MPYPAHHEAQFPIRHSHDPWNDHPLRSWIEASPRKTVRLEVHSSTLQTVVCRGRSMPPFFDFILRRLWGGNCSIADISFLAGNIEWLPWPSEQE